MKPLRLPFFVGAQEFARQWLLLSRRARFVPGTRLHELWLTSGGSAGQSGQWGLDIDEGMLNHDFTGRRWGVKLYSLDDLKRQKAEAKDGHHVQDMYQLIVWLEKFHTDFGYWPSL